MECVPWSNWYAAESIAEEGRQGRPVLRFRDNISADIPQAGSEEQEEETFVPEEFWKDVHKQFINSQILAAVKLTDKMSRK